MPSPLPPVGRVLRGARRHARVTQLELSNRTGISTRHLSYVETGRATPTRELLARVSAGLELGPGDRDDLLRAAGYAPASPRLLSVDRTAVQQVVDAVHPVAAVVIDARWTLVAANSAFTTIARGLLGSPLPVGTNIVAELFRREGLGAHVDDIDSLRAAVRAQLDRQRAVTGDPELDLLAESLPSASSPTGRAVSPHLQLAMSLRTPLGVIRIAATPAVLGLPDAPSEASLALELFTPVDATSAALLRRWVELLGTAPD